MCVLCVAYVRAAIRNNVFIRLVSLTNRWSSIYASAESTLRYEESDAAGMTVPEIE